MMLFKLQKNNNPEMKECVAGHLANHGHRRTCRDDG